MGKRGNSEGNVRKRADGRWEARMTLQDGSRKSFYGATRQEVVKQLADGLRERDQGLLAQGERQTVAQYLESWLDARKHRMKPRPWRRASDIVRLHIVPVVGATQLNKLTPQQVQGLYARKLEEGLSPTTVHHIHEVLHAGLQGALRLNLVMRNVSDLVDPPRMSRRKLTTLNERQAQALVSAVAGTRWEALYVLALTTGMRMGELLALHWSDINLANGSLQVNATLFFDEGVPHFSEPKTAHSRRRIALGRRAVDALTTHRELVKMEQLVAPEWTDLDLVFPDIQGQPINGKNLLRAQFRPHLVKAGLPLIRFHDLRHTAATLLLGRGVNPKVVSEMLGHSTIAITLDIYSHVMPHMQQEAAGIMDDVLGSK